MKKIYDFYYNNIKVVEKIVELIFEISLYVIVFLGHKIEPFEITYGYRVASVFLIVFGVWCYSIKNQTTKDTIINILLKLATPFLAAIVVAKLTNKVDVSDLLPPLYTIPIVVIYLIGKRKTNTRINGQVKKMSANDVLRELIGEYSLVPESSPYIVALITVLLNMSGMEIVTSVVFTFFIFNGAYIHIISKYVYPKQKAIKENSRSKIKLIDNKFVSFRIREIMIMILGVICLICIILLAINFNLEIGQLKEISQFAFNIILGVGVIGIVMLTVSINLAEINQKNSKKEALIKYMEVILILMLISILGYIISYIGLYFDKWIIKVYCIAILLSLVFVIIHTVKNIAFSFNIKKN